MREPFVAESALERFVTGVDPDVFLQKEIVMKKNNIWWTLDSSVN